MPEFNKYTRLDEICTHAVYLFQQIKRENPDKKYFCFTDRYAAKDFHNQLFFGLFSLYRIVMKDSYDLCIRNIGFLEKVRLKFWKHYKVLKRYCHINSKKENKDFIWEEYAKISSTWFFNKLKENAKATDEELKVLWETYYK